MDSDSGSASSPALNERQGERHWLTKEEAATILGCSTRAIERRAAAGQLATRGAQRHGKRPATLYDAGDVERVRLEMLETQRRPSELAALGPALSPAAGQVSTVPSIIATLVTALRDGSAIAAQPTRQWLTPEELAVGSRLSPRLLRRLASSGQIVAVKDGREWKIASDALDGWSPRRE